MTKNNDELATQQVLFDDMDSMVEHADEQFKESSADGSIMEQVTFDNDDYCPITTESTDLNHHLQTELNTEQLNQGERIVQSGKYAWLWRIALASFATLFIIEAVDFFTLGFEQSPIIASLYAVLFTSIAFIASNSLWREFIGLRQFKSRQKMKQRAVALQQISTGQQSELLNKRGQEFCDNISKNLPCDLVFDQNTDMQHWHEVISNEHTSAELIQIYSRVVLSKVDDKALNEISKFSTEAVVLVALSPIALLDMLIMLSRNLRMINKIAGLYGLKLGYWSRIKLIKQVFVNMAYAGASELITDYGSDILGAEMLGKLSARFAQGLGAGMLTARLGAKTMELCRPIPFEDKPKLTLVRKKIAQQIKSLLSH